MSIIAAKKREFLELVNQYQRQAGQGSTFTVLGLFNTPYREVAIAQMQAYLAGDRTELVTDQSIGLQGEGVVTPASQAAEPQADSRINTLRNLAQRRRKS